MKLLIIFFTLTSYLLSFTHTTYSSDSNNSSELNINIQKLPKLEYAIELTTKSSTPNNEIIVKSIPPIEIKQPQNWFLLGSLLITITIVIMGALITRRQIDAKTEESINAFNKTLGEQARQANQTLLQQAKQFDETSKQRTDEYRSQIEIAAKNVKIEVLSKNRQAWINTLREDLSEYIGIIEEMDGVIKLAIEESQKEGGKSVYSIAEKAGKLIGLDAKIKLSINPNEPDNQKLVILLDELLELVNKQASTNIKVTELIHLSQHILKEEWKKVKDIS